MSLMTGSLPIFVHIDGAEVLKEDNQNPPSDTYIVRKLAYCAAPFLVAIFVTALFHHLGVKTLVAVLLYLASLASIKLSMKHIFSYGFFYPKFITSLHLTISCVAAFTFMFVGKLTRGSAITVPTTGELFFVIVPIALTSGLSIAAENSALVLVTSAFAQVLASASPMISAFITLAFGMYFNVQLLVPIVVVVMGCVITIQGEVAFSSMGLALLLGASLLRGMKAVLQQRLMTGPQKDRYNPVALMAWTCLVSCVELFAFSLYTEGSAPLYSLMASTRLLGLVASIGVSCVIAVTLNLSALFLIENLGAVGMQMVAQINGPLVVLIGVTALSESFTAVEVIGFLFVLVGVFWYSKMKKRLDTLDSNGKK